MRKKQKRNQKGQFKKYKYNLSKKTNESLLIILLPVYLTLFLSTGIITAESKEFHKNYITKLYESKKITIYPKVKPVNPTIEEIPFQVESAEDKPRNGQVRKGLFYSYNSEESQTDSTPFIMANGEKVFDGAIANNCLPFGTKIELQGKIYIVSDRMNSRYDCDTFDIWKASKQESINFGKQHLDYIIIK